MTHNLLVVGGNGFVGSAVCRAALGHGWQVTSMSSSGRPFRTPKGHAPAWTSQVSWHAASALEPDTYRALLRGKTAIVHTVGTLFENSRYKDALRRGDIGAFAREVLFHAGDGGSSDPLKRGATNPASYESLNKETALRVCETFLSAVAESSSSSPPVSPELRPYPFIYLSAEDMGRPFIPRRYIETKRQAEHAIAELCAKNDGVRGVYIRPSFIYHPHLRPVSSLIAAAASLSATTHEHAPSLVPTPSRILRALSGTQTPDSLPSALQALANTLELAPIHLDHIGEAVCRVIERPDVMGTVSVKRMRHLIGWGEDQEEVPTR